MKLIIHEHGDTSVGYPESYYLIECPFERNDLSEVDLLEFKVQMLEIYEGFAESNMDAEYEFEITV